MEKQGNLEPMAGFEPATCCLRNSCSAPELHRRSEENTQNGNFSTGQGTTGVSPVGKRCPSQKIQLINKSATYGKNTGTKPPISRQITWLYPVSDKQTIFPAKDARNQPIIIRTEA